MRAYSRNPVELVWRGLAECGPVFRIQLLNSHVTVLTGADGNEAFLRAKDDVLSLREPYKMVTPIFGKGIAYDAEPEQMREQMSFAMPALRSAQMRAHADRIAQEVEAFVAGWGDEGEIDIVDACNELTMYIASRCLLGLSFRSALNRRFTELYHDLERGMVPLAFFFPHLPIPRFIARDRARREMVKLIEQVVDERRRAGQSCDDALQALMDARYASGRALNSDEITGLLLSMVFAGHHTSAVLAAWLGIELHRHPAYLDKVRSELSGQWPNAAALDSAALKQMPDMHNAIMETERLHPPLVSLLRKCVGDFEFAGFHVPKGDLVMISPAVSNRCRDAFQQPHVFDPSRFAAPRHEQHAHAFALSTFGGGTHACIGTHFARLQVQVIWAYLLRHFEFELLNTSYEPNHDFMVVGPKQPAKMGYRRRRHASV